MIAALAENAILLSEAIAQDTPAAAPPLPPDESFASDHVRKLAEEMAAREFAKPRVEMPEPSMPSCLNR